MRDRANICILGDGLLGSTLDKLTDWECVSRTMHGFDATKPDFELIPDHCGTIVNCIANTDTYSTDRESVYAVNYKFVRDLYEYCWGSYRKLVHISSDFVYAGSTKPASEDTLPVPAKNWYSYSKLLADEYIMVRDNYLSDEDWLIIRCGFKPDIFPYQSAWDDVWGSFDTVTEISKRIITLVENGASGLYNVGTQRKTIYDLAKLSNPSVDRMGSPIHIPKNTTMYLRKYTDWHKSLFPKDCDLKGYARLY